MIPPPPLPHLPTTVPRQHCDYRDQAPPLVRPQELIPSHCLHRLTQAEASCLYHLRALDRQQVCHPPRATDQVSQRHDTTSDMCLTKQTISYLSAYFFFPLSCFVSFVSSFASLLTGMCVNILRVAYTNYTIQNLNRVRWFSDDFRFFWRFRVMHALCLSGVAK